MSVSLPQIFTFILIYLSILFGSAYATEQGWLPKRITHNRSVRVISLGVFAGALSFYGTLGIAANFGSSYLLYYFGASAVFLVAPLLLNPMAKIAFAHKLGSLADVFSFRYPKPWVGGIVSLFLLSAAIPLLAAQIHAVAETVHLLNQEISRDGLALIFCATMAVFAILFGARHASTRDKHEGLIVALGLEALLKLLAFGLISIYAVFWVFDGFDNLDAWLTSSEVVARHADKSLSEGSSRLMLLTFFAGTIAMPHMFHILLTENDDTRVIQTARWGFPLYMMLLGIFVAPIYWASDFLQLDGQPEFFTIALGLATNNEFMTMAAFLGGFAACSGALIALTLALATMTVNHLVLPLSQGDSNRDFFSFLLNSRRIVITAIIFLSYSLYSLLSTQQNLINLGLVSFIAVLQFLPGLIAAFYWRDANSTGLLAGLVTGFLFWAATLFFPLLIDIVSSSILGSQQLFAPSPDVWYLATIASVIANTLALILFSRLSEASQDEKIAAAECLSDSPVMPYQGELGLSSVSEIEQQLTKAIGASAARAQTNLALDDLKFSETEQRSFALVQVRNQIESNLTSIVGQTVAHQIFAEFLPFRAVKPGQLNIESLQSREYRFEVHQSNLTGLAAELDNLRRYHRQLLQDLPTAVCSLDVHGRVLTWNRAMVELTQVEADTVLDYPLQTLPSQWSKLLEEFVQSLDSNQHKVEVPCQDQMKTLNLHKERTDTGDILIVIEDRTEEQSLESQLMHNQRLAAIGQLAAGVAHEIGNPITGIACLAQNIPIETDDPELLEISREIRTQTDRISAIVNSLVNFAHRGQEATASNKQPVHLHQCIDEAIGLLSLSSDAKAVQFRNDVKADDVIAGDSQRLLQVFINVLSNARDASPANSEITVWTEPAGSYLRIMIRDHGHGIREDARDAIFEPFFTTKDPGQGTGLGLAIVATIIEEHQGKVQAGPAIPSGTLVTIELPKDAHTGNERLTSTAHS